MLIFLGTFPLTFPLVRPGYISSDAIAHGSSIPCSYSRSDTGVIFNANAIMGSYSMSGASSEVSPVIVFACFGEQLESLWKLYFLFGLEFNHVLSVACLLAPRSWVFARCHTYISDISSPLIFSIGGSSEKPHAHPGFLYSLNVS